MGKFRAAVQLDEVAGPLRSQFKLKNWTAEHSKLREDESDDALYQAGLLVHAKANHIRKELKVTFSGNLRATTKVRAFAAIVNYNMITIREKTKAEMLTRLPTQLNRDICELLPHRWKPIAAH